MPGFIQVLLSQFGIQDLLGCLTAFNILICQIVTVRWWIVVHTELSSSLFQILTNVKQYTNKHDILWGINAPVQLNSEVKDTPKNELMFNFFSFEFPQKKNFEQYLSYPL